MKISFLKTRDDISRKTLIANPFCSWSTYKQCICKGDILRNIMGGPGSVALGVIEEKVDNLLACIQPNGPSELRRFTIASYICDLIRRCFASQRQVRSFYNLSLNFLFSKNSDLPLSFSLILIFLLINLSKAG
jgi:hypothetical protein